MRMRPIYGFPFAMLFLFSGAIPSPSRADQLPSPSPPAVLPDPAAAAVAKLAMIGERVNQITFSADIGAPPAEGAPPAQVAPLAPLRQSVAAAALSAARHAVEQPRAQVAQGRTLADQPRFADIGDDQKVVQVKTVGRCQMGTAAWYGGHYVGQRTSNGERLDGIHATAAHRTLPLNSLVRVTNLKNGRSVVVRITDRGPVSESLLIDVSPKAAEQLAMKDAGIVPVSIEQVVQVSEMPR